MHQARVIPADGQAQSCAPDADCRICLIERIEDPTEIPRLDSRPRVFDGDGDDVLVPRSRRGSWHVRRPVRRW